MSLQLGQLAEFLDRHLRVADIVDYAGAFNGIQLTHRGPVRRIAAAVDVSIRTVDGAIAADANVLLVHHGMLWGGPQRFDGRMYELLRRLFEHDIAVYAAHLPLDAHEIHGNSRLVAKQLGLEPQRGFAQHAGTYVGVMGETDVATSALRNRLAAFSREYGGGVVSTPMSDERRTKVWAICSGSGASADTLREAKASGVDTLIVGEGPHWSAVAADDEGLAILFGGHYATETLGVQSLAAHVAQRFGVPWLFVAAPTGL